MNHYIKYLFLFSISCSKNSTQGSDYYFNDPVTGQSYNSITSSSNNITLTTLSNNLGFQNKSNADIISHYGLPSSWKDITSTTKKILNTQAWSLLGANYSEVTLCSGTKITMNNNAYSVSDDNLYHIPRFSVSFSTTARSAPVSNFPNQTSEPTTNSPSTEPSLINKVWKFTKGLFIKEEPQRTPSSTNGFFALYAYCITPGINKNCEPQGHIYISESVLTSDTSLANLNQPLIILNLDDNDQKPNTIFFYESNSPCINQSEQLSFSDFTRLNFSNQLQTKINNIGPTIGTLPLVQFYNDNSGNEKSYQNDSEEDTDD